MNNEAQLRGSLEDVPRLVWAWVALQAVGSIVELSRPYAAGMRVALIISGLISTVYFVRGRRWAWWLPVLFTSLALGWELARLIVGDEDRPPAFVAFVIANLSIGLVLLLTPSVRGHFRRWGRLRRPPTA